MQRRKCLQSVFPTKVLFFLLDIVCKKCFSLLCSSFNHALGLGLMLGKWGGEEKWKQQSQEKWVNCVPGVKQEWWKLQISLLDGGHGSLSTLENVLSVFALLSTKQLSFLTNRDQAEAALNSGQERTSSNTGTRSFFHGAAARSVYTVSDDSALLMIGLCSL